MVANDWEDAELDDENPTGRYRLAWTPPELLTLASIASLVLAIVAWAISGAIGAEEIPVLASVAHAFEWGDPQYVIILLLGLGAMWWNVDKIPQGTASKEFVEDVPLSDDELHLLRGATLARLVTLLFFGTIAASVVFVAIYIATGWPHPLLNWSTYSELIGSSLISLVLSVAGAVASLHVRRVCHSGLVRESVG